MSLSVYIAEDDPFLRDLLKQLLLRHDGVQIAGTAADGREVASGVAEIQPDLLLLDVDLPGKSGLQVLEDLAQVVGKPPRVLMLSGRETEETQLKALQGGAHGFVPKSQAARELWQAITTVRDGRLWFPDDVLSAAMQDYRSLRRDQRARQSPLYQLTDREREVLVLVARGLTNPQIASELYMSLSTVKVHVGNILTKLDLPNRTAAALLAEREGLIQR